MKRCAAIAVPASTLFVVAIMAVVGVIAVDNYTESPTGSISSSSSPSLSSSTLTATRDTQPSAGVQRNQTGGSSYLVTTVSSSAYTISYFPCSSPDARFPDVGQTIVNHMVTCMSGSSLVVSNGGRVDFMNGSVVELHANMTGSAMISGLYGYDTVVVTNGTRFIFNASGISATLYPYQGKEVFANGTITMFPLCIYPVSMNIKESGDLANGTVYFTGASGWTVRFYPNGTCNAASG
jgi:hypothetical protein